MQSSAQKQSGADAEPGASAALERKRRGDMEFENQLAMAMQVCGLSLMHIVGPMLPCCNSICNPHFLLC